MQDHSSVAGSSMNWFKSLSNSCSKCTRLKCTLCLWATKLVQSDWERDPHRMGAMACATSSAGSELDPAVQDSRCRA